METELKFKATKLARVSLFSGNLRYVVWFSVVVLVLLIIIFFAITGIWSSPFFYLILLILGLQLLIIYAIRFFSKKIISIEFQGDFLVFEYKRGISFAKTVLPIQTTRIELFERKDYKSFFAGIQINFVNSDLHVKLKMLDKHWRYDNFEKIYTTFKRLKHEAIPANELAPFKQLQIMNSEGDKH